MTESTANITVRRRVNGLPPTQTLPAREVPAAPTVAETQPAPDTAQEQAQADLSEADVSPKQSVETAVGPDPELLPVDAADPPIQKQAVWKSVKPRAAKAAKSKPAKAQAKAKGKAGRKPSLDEAHAAKLKKLLAGGASLTKVAAVFKISVPTAKRYATKLGFTDVAVKHKPGRKSSAKAKAAPKAKLKAFAKNHQKAKTSPRKAATAEKFNARRFAKDLARALKGWADEVE